jgi:23S rRNA (cytosine1962-C5)-methyltransferase
MGKVRDIAYDESMLSKHRVKKRSATPVAKRISQRPSAGILDQRPLSLDPAQPLSEVYLRSVTFHPFLFRKMIDRVERDARPGDLVAVHDRRGELFGHGLYNPRSEIVVRMLSHEKNAPDEVFWQARLEQAIGLRRQLLRLDRVTDAYRVVYAEADGLTGLVVDRLGDVLSAEVFSLGMFQRSAQLLQRLATLSGAREWIVQVPDSVHGQEGFLSGPLCSDGMPNQVIVTEFGTRFRVRFEGSHKTGFFCDQRENRRQLASFCDGRKVLDLCCYTGGFALQAKRLGGASDVTAVDLDENAIDIARENANLNQQRIHCVHADSFAYMRDMIAGGRRYDVVVLDPPKLIRSRRELDEGRRKHFDLNRLAMQLVEPGGLLLTCSCSGLLPEADFLDLVHAAARKATSEPAHDDDAQVNPLGRRIQVLGHTGAAPDHPVVPNCPETEYLKAIWLRVL